MTERDERGRFVVGNSASPGRPPKAREERFLEITLAACTFADWEAIVKKAVEQAKRGDATARKWLGDYVVGPPTQRQELTGVGGGPIEFDDYREKLQRSILSLAQSAEAAAILTDADSAGS